MVRRLFLVLAAGSVAASIPACSSGGGGAGKKSAPASVTSDTSTGTGTDTTTTNPPCTASTGQSTAGGASSGGAIVNPGSTDLGSGTATASGTGSATGTSTSVMLDLELELTDNGAAGGLGSSSGNATGTATSTSLSSGTSTGSSSSSAGFAAISQIVSGKCATCHNGTLAPTDYTAQSGWDNDATMIGTRLQDANKPMPPANSTALSDTDKKALLAYVNNLGGSAAPASTGAPCVSSGGTVGPSSTGGTVGTSTDPNAAGTGGTATGGMGDPGMTTATSAPNSAFFQTFFNPPALQQCNQQGHIFNRGTSTCVTTQTLSSKCDYPTIQAKYGAAGAAKLATLQSTGYIPDQCGTDQTGAFVSYFVCIQDSGNPQCVQPSQAQGDHATIAISCINTLCH